MKDVKMISSLQQHTCSHDRDVTSRVCFIILLVNIFNF